MPTENEEKTVLGFFDGFKNQPFEFVCVTDIDVVNHPNYYKAIFKNIKNNSFYSLALAPEYMRYKYKVGHIYTNGEHVGQNKTLLQAEFTVNSDPTQTLQPLSSILTQDEAKNIIDYENVSKYFLRQFAHVEEQEDCTLIIPCYTIANRFYFLSSSMKRAALTESIESLYYKGSFHADTDAEGKTTVKVHIKSKAGKKDLLFLCRFIGNSFARHRFEYLMSLKNFTTAARPYQPIKAQFPTQKIFDIYASYIYVGDDARGKPKYLVVNIHSDNLQFGFDEILYKQYSNKTDPKTVPPENTGVPKPPGKYKKKVPKREDKVYTGTPSSEYDLYLLRPNENEDDHFKTDTPTTLGTTIYNNLEGPTPSFNTDNKNKVGNSFEKASANGDENLGEAAVTNDDDESEAKERNIFNLSNFYQFYEALLTYAGVSGSQLEAPYEIDKIKNDKKRGYKSKSILDRDENSSRHFLFGELGYNGKTAYIVEIEQDKSWGPSTWIFIDESNSGSYDADTMHELIKYYINGEKMTYEKFENHIQKKYGLDFRHQNHKNGDIDDITIERWCESVLKKI